MKTLVTERLILRDWKLSDLDDYFKIKSNPNITIHDGELPKNSVEECLPILKYLIEVKNNYALELKENGIVVGSVGINEDAEENDNARNIGFVLNEDYWNQGLMSEALREIIANAHEYTVFLSCGHSIDNVRSEHIIKKLGFQFIKIIHDVRGPNGSFRDNLYYLLDVKKI